MLELIKKLLLWGFVFFLFFFMAFRPEAAAELFKGIGAALMAVFQGFGDFFTSLVS
jgi:hypothetical protein